MWIKHMHKQPKLGPFSSSSGLGTRLMVPTPESGFMIPPPHSINHNVRLLYNQILAVFKFGGLAPNQVEIKYWGNLKFGGERQAPATYYIIIIRV